MVKTSSLASLHPSPTAPDPKRRAKGKQRAATPAHDDGAPSNCICPIRSYAKPNPTLLYGWIAMRHRVRCASRNDIGHILMPRMQEELVVHKKKVNDVRQWLKEALDSPALQKYRVRRS